MQRSSVKVGAAKFGALGFLALALGCAAFAAYLIGTMMQSKYTGSKVQPVVVAKTELRAGLTVRADSLEVRDWPEEALPPGSFASIEEFLAAHEGATATVGILPGEAIVGARMATARNGTGVAPLVHPNMRAIALKVDDALGFTGLVYPGAYVDVVATIRDPMGAGASSRIAVQRARVLSVGMDADVATRRVQEQKMDKLTSSPEGGGTFVTLEVSPDEAEIISIARNEGVIDLVLRNATDDQIVETSGATPAMFSTTGADESQDSGDSGSTRASAERRPTVKLQNKKIQIVANDSPDKPKPAANTGTIETYNAN